MSDIPVSGRLEPRPAPLPEGVTHRVTFHGGSEHGISVRCAPCAWSIWIDGGHDIADLAELVRQHTGGEVHHVPRVLLLRTSRAPCRPARRECRRPVCPGCVRVCAELLRDRAEAHRIEAWLWR